MRIASPRQYGQSVMRGSILIGAALMLQGCLVAAIPMVAGGAMASRDVINESRDDRASAPAPAETAAAPASTALTSASDADLAAVSETAVEPTKDQSASSSAYTDFASYALTQAMLAEGSAQSAILENPGALDGARAACAGVPAAVLIDLDPAGKMLALEGATQSDPAFASQLELLRRQDVTIGWISQRLVIDAERVRAQLANAGLDPLGEDVLLLLNSFDQNKQQRRRAFGQSHCLVAIAGDTMTDFDELFDYLKNPDSALRLNSLRNAGWFITPLPLMPLNKE